MYANDRELIQRFARRAGPDFLFAGEACYDAELERYAAVLRGKPRILVGTKMDLDGGPVTIQAAAPVTLNCETTYYWKVSAFAPGNPVPYFSSGTGGGAVERLDCCRKVMSLGFQR